MAEPDIPSPQPPSLPAPVKYTIFRGPNGIRAGWRLVIFILLMGTIVFIAALPFAVLRAAHRGGSFGIGGASALTPTGTAISEAILFLVPAVAALIMARIEKREFGEYGLPARYAFRKNFWLGTLAGFIAISGCLLGIFVFGGFHLTGLAIHGGTILSATLAWSGAFILVGLAEEFLFRGYMQYTLTTGIGFWPSAIILSCLFGLAHSQNPGESRFGLFSVVLFALLFCLFLRRTGNLWWAVGFHAGWDWGQTFFYGVPDSGLVPYHNLLNSAFSGSKWITGGTVGPEASVFTPLVLGIVAIWFSRVYRANQYVVEPAPAGIKTGMQVPLSE